MDLPDCPPGAEGYHDVVVGEVPRKPEVGECTKAEIEFQEHLKSLKIKLEDDSTRCMVEKRGRDVSGKWIYLCYPCAAVCSGEAILQTHISGKKHKNKLAMRQIWPLSIFEEHPYIVGEKGAKGNSGATDLVLQKMAEEVDLHNKDPSDLDSKYHKYRNARCHLQDNLDALKAPLIGLEYLVEHPPEEVHYEPSYICVLCSKQGHPRTIVNHMTCFWHRYNYLIRHFPKATTMLAPYRSQNKYREGVSVIMNRLAQRIEDKFGRLRPVNIDKQEYDKDKERIHQWIFKSRHFSEQDGHTFEEVVDVDLITSLHRSNEESKLKTENLTKDPSPPVVAAPRAKFNNFTRSSGRQERRAGSLESLSDLSDGDNPKRHHERARGRGRMPERRGGPRGRFEPYPSRRRDSPPTYRSKYAIRNVPSDKDKEKQRPPNYEYKLKLAEEKAKAAEESAKKTLAYHDKNPEKHPLYPEEWKKFWNRRYKEIQAEGKDPSKHDFKPEWIVFWTTRMKQLHEEEMRVNVLEIYRKLCLSPPDMTRREPQPKSQQERSRKSPERTHKSLERRWSPAGRRSPDYDRRRRSPERRRPEPPRRRPEPEKRKDFRSRSPEYRRSPPRRHSPPRPVARSRSPVRKVSRPRSPARTHITLESARRSRSPLSRREQQLRNVSPHRPTITDTAPALQTVCISDDELKTDDHLSPWNSDNDIESLGSLPDARSPPRSHRSNSIMSHASRGRRDYGPASGPPARGADPQDLGPPENVVATLRLLVALEDYLGSIGPKVIDLMTTAIKMEKEAANSSEDLLERESALVLIETAKEKLKGAAQAGLVPAAAAPAVRSAVVRAAATLHAADTRARKKQQSGPKPSAASSAAVGVAGVGSVDRAEIAQQMAAALIAQGKTDVSSEELAQLVDAVVGMAEAKKREAEVKKKVEARAMSEKQARPAVEPSAISGTASALQMLQSAYDENDKKTQEKEDVPDAMDGLSDSDLETLLKNFNELSAEEQHSLIAYLKKLEAKEPRRVEKLRQYVSAAAASAPKTDEPEVVEVKSPANPRINPVKSDEVKPVTIESDDDDDYTVEEVFQSATQKVKEDQIRQEMEIVKKSLEESKATPPKESPKPTPNIDITNKMSSATDLFALVQASIQATSKISPVSMTSDVTSVQPKSFGDAPEQASDSDKYSNVDDQYTDINTQYAPPVQNIVQPMNNMSNAPPVQPTPYNPGFRPAPNQIYGSNMGNEPFNNAPTMDHGGNMGNQPYNAPTRDHGGNMGNQPYNNAPMRDQRSSTMNVIRGPGPGIGLNMSMGRPMGGPGRDNFAPEPYNQGNFVNGKMQNNFGPGPGMNQYQNQGKFGGNQNYGRPQGNFGGNQGNPGHQNFGGNQGHPGSHQNFGGNQGNPGSNQSFGGNQGNPGSNQSFGGNPQGNFRGRGRGNFGGNRGRGRGYY